VELRALERGPGARNETHDKQWTRCLFFIPSSSLFSVFSFAPFGFGADIPDEGAVIGNLK
jgi:hypothetical protein